MNTDKPNQISARRTMQGVVVSKSGINTVKIEVVRYVQHPLYRKQLKRTKNYMVHDPENKAAVGQTITVRECRPISKHKRWLFVAVN
jgi:small subunit ribosomal protein S17